MVRSSVIKGERRICAREGLPVMVAGLEAISDGAALDQVEVWRSRLEELLVRVGEHVFRWSGHVGSHLFGLCRH